MKNKKAREPHIALNREDNEATKLGGQTIAIRMNS
jgi:hypothetical protein